MNAAALSHIRTVKQLVPPRGLSQEIIRVVTDDQADLVDLVSIINKSPTIAARLLRCANSAYYGQRGEIATVREAIIRVLGLSITRSLTLAMALTSGLNTRTVKSFDQQRYWFTAVTTAALAQGLSHYLRQREKPSPAVAYTTGLIHNIGLPALVHCFPDILEPLLQDNHRPLSERLRQALGFDHRQASAVLARSWDLPTSIVIALEGTSADAAQDAGWALAQVTDLGTRLAEALYQGSSIDPASFYTDPALLDLAQLRKVVHEVEGQLESFSEMAQLIAGGESA